MIVLCKLTIEQSKKKTKIKGFSLVEILLAVGLFMLIISSVSFFAIDSYRATNNSRRRIQAMTKLNEMSDAVILNKMDMWSSILDESDGTQKYVEYSDGEYSIVDGVDVDGYVTSSFTINSAYRDSFGNLVGEESGNLDIHTKAVTFRASWADVAGDFHEVVNTVYLNDWNTLTLEETLASDFDNGSHTNTVTGNEDDGEVKLEELFYPDWCLPELTLSSYDLPGDAVGNVISAEEGDLDIGTGTQFGDPGNMSFMHLLVDTQDPPNVNVEGSFSGYAVNDIYNKEQYTYLATEDDDREVAIIDSSVTPYTEVGYYNPSGGGDALSVDVEGDVGFVGRGRYLRSFDLSFKTGERTELDSVKVGLWWWDGLVAQVDVVGDYAYIALWNDWYELAIVDVSNPSDLQIVGKTSVNWGQSQDLFVRDDGSRVYMGTTSTGYSNEFFIFDTTQKGNDRPVVGSYESNGTSFYGISVVENYAIAVGEDGEEYQVISLADEGNPVRCGGLQMNEGMADVDSVYYEGNLYSYVISGDTDGELKVIEGGAGGGGNDGYGYPTSGEFVSQVLDSGCGSSKYYYVEWDEQVTSESFLQLQLRTSDSTDFSGIDWVGPDGTSGTYFELSEGESIPQYLWNNRYVQYRLLFTSDTVDTPIFEEIKINYQK